MDILWAGIWFAIISGLLGLLLAIASKIFAAETNEEAEKINELLPGANCGGCGYGGCSALAAAIAKGEASPAACTASSVETALKISEITGAEPVIPVRMRAQVMCSGTVEYARKKYHYQGAPDCILAVRLGGGDKLCPNGCIGLGACVSKCKFDAIKVIKGVAVVDYKKCMGCGACAAGCPKHIIKLIPYKSEHWVGCMSVEKGADTRKFCDVGCTGCGLCAKACTSDAIHVNNYGASIEYEKCTDCGKCVEKCPRMIIWSGKSQIKTGAVIRADKLKAASELNTDNNTQNTP